VSENNLVDGIKASRFADTLEELEFILDKPEEKEKEEEIVKETEPETQVL